MDTYIWYYRYLLQRLFENDKMWSYYKDWEGKTLNFKQIYFAIPPFQKWGEITNIELLFSLNILELSSNL